MKATESIETEKLTSIKLDNHHSFTNLNAINQEDYTPDARITAVATMLNINHFQSSLSKKSFFSFQPFNVKVFSVFSCWIIATKYKRLRNIYEPTFFHERNDNKALYRVVHYLDTCHLQSVATI